MDPILEQFLSEARDNLSYLDKHLKELKNKDEETVNALFRAAHTLKGGAGLVGFTAVQEITHKAEDLLDAFRNNRVEYSEEMLDALYDAVDEVIELIDAAEEEGTVDVDVDEKRIESIKNNITKLLESGNKKEDSNENGEENLNTQLSISDFYFGELINVDEIINIEIPLETPKITNRFLEENNYWIIDMDLDEDTVKLGNDPYYILYLLGDGNIKCLSSFVNCEGIQNDPYLWRTRIIAVVYSNKEIMEDAFYNIIDEVNISPLSIENIFKTTYESSENEIYEDFVNELKDSFKKGDYDEIKSKIRTAVEILNKESKEGYVLNTLYKILARPSLDEEKSKKTIQIALKELGIFTEEKHLEDKRNEEKPKQEFLNLSEKEIEVIEEILQSQLKVIDVIKEDDISSLKSVKLILGKIAKTVGADIEELKLDKREIKQAIGNILNSVYKKYGLSPRNIEPKENEIEEKDIETSSGKRKLQESQKESSKLQKPETSAVSVKQHSTHLSKTIKINQEVIDELMDIVGELLVMKNALPYIANNIGKVSHEESKREILNKFDEISRLTDQLQDKVMGMRLLPLSYIFGRYPKLIRDLSKKLNKKIKYIEEGSETKLDKMMIEKLADPLIHLIRNSIDHGIETVEERVKKGKNEEGILKISAHSKGDKVFIEISDDGAGINTQKLVSKVLEKGMMDPEKLESMSEEEKLQLIFLPGLSTKDEVSELSGRGVGGDAVKRVVDELGGKIHIKSAIDEGTTIILELPVSVALTNVFHVKMNNINYAISMEHLVETVKVEKSRIKRANHKPFIKIRGELIPLIFERELLGDEYQDRDEYSIIVIQGKTSKYGFVVDEFVGQLDVVQKPLDGVLKNHPFISGTSLLGNGEVLFILDPSKLVKE